MSDLTFTKVAAKLPANSIVADGANNDVKISLKALMGETSVSLTDEKVGEFISKFLDACSAAQTDFNADSANTFDLRSYPSPSAGSPIRDSTTGNFSATFTYTVSLSVPLDKNTVNALKV